MSIDFIRKTLSIICFLFIFPVVCVSKPLKCTYGNWDGITLISPSDLSENSFISYNHDHQGRENFNLTINETGDIVFTIFLDINLEMEPKVLIKLDRGQVHNLKGKWDHVSSPYGTTITFASIYLNDSILKEMKRGMQMHIGVSTKDGLIQFGRTLSMKGITAALNCIY